jgi:hypothetical protein
MNHRGAQGLSRVAWPSKQRLHLVLLPRLLGLGLRLHPPHVQICHIKVLFDFSVDYSPVSICQRPSFQSPMFAWAMNRHFTTVGALTYK